MKVQKLVRKMYRAILQNDQDREKELYLKLLKKSVKHKRTYAVR